MKKLAIVILMIICSCQSPNGTVTTNDERSEIIKTLFKQVSEENIDYLKEVFSDDMTFVDARNNTKDKAGFIAGVEGLFEMFDDISFEDVDGDATGSALHKNDLMPRELALTKIWRDDNYFTSRSMDVYIAKLRKYLKNDASVEILNIHGEGFRLVDKN